jgi:hypothetical protein
MNKIIILILNNFEYKLLFRNSLYITLIIHNSSYKYNYLY